MWVAAFLPGSDDGFLMDFSIPFGLEIYHWISRPLKGNPPVAFFDGFDGYTWALCLASMLAVSGVLTLPFYMMRHRRSMDLILILITPIALLVAEDFPKWFTAKADRGTGRADHLCFFWP